MKRPMMFREEDAGGPSAGVTATAPVIEDTPPASDTPPAKETPPTVDVDALTKSLATQFGDVLTEKFKTSEPTERKVDELTPEEAKKALNVWEPSEAWFKKYDNLDTRAEAIAEMRDGVVKHTDTITQYRVREALKDIAPNMERVTKFMEDYQNEQATNRFHKSYEQLADPALEPLVKAVTDDLLKQGKKYNDEKALFSDIASGVEKVIQVTNKDFKLTAGSTPAATKSSQSSGGLPTMSPGAGGGAAQDAKTAAPAKRGIAVFQR